MCKLPSMGSKVLYRKVDRIVYRMQNPNEGVPVRSQKYFRISVPYACTGMELIEWLMQRLGIEDNSNNYLCTSRNNAHLCTVGSLMVDIAQIASRNFEALHLATLLCQLGYFFPVFERSFVVKDDNTLYRFQIPYFWPSHSGNPDNVEYAIHLTKRLMRNELKHGLEEYEAEAYNRMRELLGHIWDFINTQAEIQLKLFKERKKIEKVIFDSQEKAYWRLHRPPPPTANIFDESYGKGDKKLKKLTGRDYAQELDRLKVALKTKPWLKTRKSVENLVSWSDQYSEYDPFLTGCQPGNPWITDEPLLWQLNADFVEVPTERRVRRWGFSIQELIRDPIGRQVLETFLESEFSQENIRFWSAVQDLKYSPKSQVPEKIDAIYNEFLASGATCQVNVDSRTLESTIKNMSDPTIPPRFVFSNAEEHIYILMDKDSYPRFVRSEIYKSVLSAAQQQGSKRIGWKNFLFNKKPSTTGAIAASGTVPQPRQSSPGTSNRDLASSPGPLRQTSFDHKLRLSDGDFTESLVQEINGDDLSKEVSVVALQQNIGD